MKSKLSAGLVILMLGSLLHAESVISIVTKFSKTGGLYGDAGLNTVGDKVNGRSICSAANDNNNSVPGCDMSADPGYNDNGTSDETDDYYTGDLIVRTSDLIEVTVGWNATQVDNPITLTSTLPSFGGANYLGWDSLPSSCQDGSSISEDGLTLTCVRTNDASISYSEDSPFHIKVKPHAPNGLETGPISFSISSDGLETKTDDTDGYGITVTAKPMWNIQKAHISTSANQTVDGVTGYIIRYAYLLEADEVSGEEDTTSAVLGNEALGKNFSLSFTDNVSGVSANAKLVGCSVSGAEGPSQPYPWYHSDEPEKSVGSLQEDLSVSCSQAGDGADITIDYSGIDASLEHVPTLYANGGIIPKTRMPIASGVVEIFVPEEDVKNATDIGNDSYELDTNNTLTSFDPTSISGQSNFGDLTESTKDNSVVVPLLYRGPGYVNGRFHKYFTNDLDVSSPLPDVTYGYYSADGVLTPGKTFASYVIFANNGNADFNQTVICDVMDANLYDVVDLPGSTTSAVKLLGSTGSYNPIVEYATGYVNSWPPALNQNNAGAVITECKDSSVTWYSTTSDARDHGPITKVRMRFQDGGGLPAHAAVSFTINLKARSTDLGGNIIPSNTNFVNYTAVHDTVLYEDKNDTDNWLGASRILNTYPTAPYGGDYRADRAVLVRAKVRTTKELSTVIVEPSDEVTVRISSTFTSDSDENESNTVKITEMLAPGLVYVAGSGNIGDPTIGICNDLEASDPLSSTCTPDHQILIWDLGTRTANEALPDIEYNFVVSAFTPAGTSNTYTIISSPTDTSNPNIRKANKNISVNIPASLFITKEVNTPFVDTDTMIRFTSYGRNGSSVDLTEMDMIDILPFNGDGGSGTDKGFKFTVASTKVKIKRELPTSYHGTLQFTKAIGSLACDSGVTWYYTDREPNKINISPTDSSNQAGGATAWCEGNDTGPAASCGYGEADVTAVRLTGPSLSADQTCGFEIQLTPQNNKKGDVYTNTTSAYAQGVTLPTLSNHVSAFVPTTLLGDLVWLDYDADGIQDADEPGAGNISVKLLDENNAEINSTTTDADGKYQFDELTPDTPYKIQAVIPSYYSFTSQDAGGDDKKDSDVDTTTGISGTKTLNLNQQYRHLDVGLISTLTIAGDVYKKVDNSSMDNTVVKLYIDENNDGLIDENDTLIQTQDISGNSAYEFINVFDGNYVVGVFETSGFSNEYALLSDEVLDADVNGSSIVDKDFVYGSRPTSTDITHETILNFSGAVTLEDLDGGDADGTVEHYSITSLPSSTSGVLYLSDGTTPVTAGMSLTPAQAQGLKFEPQDGFVGNAVFHYASQDDDNLTDLTPATFTIPVRGLHISGHVFQDGNGDTNVGGSGIAMPGGTQLYATLLATDNSLIDSLPVESNGSYLFTEGISPDSDYKVIITTQQNATAPALPTAWNNTGEQPGNDGAGNDGTADGTLAVHVSSDDIPDNDFGINHKPTADNKTETSQLNPGGTTQVTVPTLTGNDDESGTTLIYKITELPTNATLYHSDGTPVQMGDTVDPAALKVDPDDGDQTVTFKYTTTDEAGVISDEATVTMPFTNLIISGHLFDDGDGDSNVNGTAIHAPGSTQLHATLLDDQGNPLATTPIATDGSYSFDNADGVIPNTDYSVVLATSANATTADLPTNWNNTGENINSAGSGNDGAADGKITVSVTTTNVSQVDFGINHKPTADDKAETSQLNPGGNTQVAVPALTGNDDESTTLVYTVTALPTNATLYYDGTEITNTGFVVTDPTKLTVDPIDGDQTVTFTYTTTDKAGVTSDKATVTMPFIGLGIAGTLYDDGDANTDGNVDGTPISRADDVQLYVHLVGADGNVIISKPLANDGTYLFTGEEGVTANTSYTVVLGTTQATVGNPVPAADLPQLWNHTGENINSAGAGDDGDANGTISVVLGTVAIPQVDFGINKKPKAEDLVVEVQSNPSGAAHYPVPNLPISDQEDDTPTTVTIKTLPTPETGVLYYDGVPVTAGEVIENFDPTRLTVDPVNANPTMIFTYTTTDAAGVESDPATVTMPFLGDIYVGDRVWMDSNGNGAQDPGEPGVSGVVVTLHDENGTQIAITATDENGHYQFKIEVPGRYHIEFDNDHYYTRDCPPCSDDNDSDVSGQHSATAPFDLDWGDNDMTHDAGITPTAHIGDYFWIDANKNGIQDPGEEPVTDALVEMLDENGSKLYWTDETHTALTTEETDWPVETRTSHESGHEGEYGLDVPAGRTYRVRFSIPSDDSKYAGYVFTNGDTSNGSDDADTDETGVTVVVVNATQGANILTLDAGINCGCADASIQSNGGDALGTLGLLFMILMTLGSGLLFVRREAQTYAEGN